MGDRDVGPARALLEVARDLQALSDRHAGTLRGEGLDDVAEQMEQLVAAARTGAEELGAALQPPPDGGDVSRDPVSPPSPAG